MDFEEFKKYHNANYHDGDSTFDELNYSRSNGDDFENEFVQDCFDHFKAGQQSKQAEIDGLENKLKYEKSAYRNIKLQFLNKQDDLDELQAEIDDLKNKIQTALNRACMLQNSSGERIYTELKEMLK